jgi:hypothetical protein
MRIPFFGAPFFGCPSGIVNYSGLRETPNQFAKIIWTVAKSAKVLKKASAKSIRPITDYALLIGSENI